MRYLRSIIPVLFVLTTCFCNSAPAQKRLYDSHADGLCAFTEPRTRLEEFESRVETVLIKGATTIATLSPNGAAVRVDALELRDTSNSTRASGIAVHLNESGKPWARSLVDYDQIDDLVKSLDQIAQTDNTATKLQYFEARFRTRGDLEFSVFRQTKVSNIAATVSGGACERVTIPLTLEELNKLRWMIVQAKARLDEIK